MSAVVMALTVATLGAAAVWLLPRTVNHVFGQFRAVDVTFTDEQHGWVLGRSGCGTWLQTCARLLRTTDGGRSWQAVTLPADLAPATEGVPCGDLHGQQKTPCADRVRFADEQNGYLWSVNSFLVTHDGGRSWRTNIGGAITVVVTGTSVVRVGSHSVEVARAGSDVWRAVSPGGTPSEIYRDATVAADAGVTYLFGDVPELQYRSTAYRSTDGGRTWHAVKPFTCGNPVANGTPAAVAPDGAAVVVCGSQSGQGAELRVSVDGGTSYGPARALPRLDAPNPAPLLAVSRRVFLQLVQSGTTGAVTGAYRTVDGGITWSRVQPPHANSSITFLSTTFGYAVGGRYLSVAITTDGGATWHTRRVR